MGRLLSVDLKAATTSLRVTLHDGSKVVVKLNLTHTVADLKAHLEAYLTLPFISLLPIAPYERH